MMNFQRFTLLYKEHKIQVLKFLSISGFLLCLINYNFSAVYLPILTYSFYQINQFSPKKRFFLDANFGFVFYFLSFFTWAEITLLWTINFENGLSVWIKSLLLSIFAGYFCIATSWHDHGFYRQWLKWVVIFYLLGITFLFFEKIFNYPFIDFLFYSGIKKTDIAYMQYCLYKPLVTSLSMLFPAIALYIYKRFFTKRTFTIITLILLYVLSFIAIKLANALSATIGFLCGGAIFLLTRYYSKLITEILKRFFVVYTLILPIFSFYGLKNIYNLRSIFPPSLDNLFYRLCIWHFTSEKIAEKPILGWGLGASKEFPGGDAYVTGGVMAMPSHPHNNILQLYLELGVIGTVFYISLILLLFKFIQQNSKDNYALAAGNFFMVLTFVICNMSFNVWHMWYISWFIICFKLIQIVNNMKFIGNRAENILN